MINRYEKIFTLENIENQPDREVEILSGQLVYDLFTKEKKVQLTLKMVGSCPSDGVQMLVRIYDQQGGEVMSHYLNYDDCTYTQGMVFGEDMYFKVDDCAMSFAAEVEQVYYEDDVNLYIKYQTPKSFFRSHVPDLEFHIDDYHAFDQWFPMADGDDCVGVHHRGKLHMIVRNPESGKQTDIHMDLTEDCALYFAYNKKTGAYDITPEDISSIDIQ